MKFVLIGMVIMLSSGCMWVESMTKAATDAALDAVELRVKVIPTEMMAIGKKYKDAAIEAAVEAAAKKSVEYGRAAMLFVIRQAKLDPMTFDHNGDGMLSDVELNMAVNAAKKSEDLPWWLYLLLSAGGSGALFTTVKTGRRYLGGAGKPSVTMNTSTERTT